MAIGPILREARLNKQLTASQVAEMTRMKIQIVEDLENDDFHRIAATIYGKGFIKLYAECVDLDPGPLLEDYLRSVGKGTPEAPQRTPEPEKLTRTVSSHHGKDVAFPNREVAAQAPVGDEAETEDLFSYAVKRTPRAGQATNQESRRSAQAPEVPRAASTKTPLSGRVSAMREWLLTAYRKMVDKWARFIEILASRFAEAGAHDKWIQRGLIALGVAILLLILIPMLRPVLAPAPRLVADQELILFAPLPEPYLPEE